MNPQPDDAEALELLDDYLSRLHAGETVNRQTLLRRRPDLAPIVAVIDKLQAIVPDAELDEFGEFEPIETAEDTAIDSPSATEEDSGDMQAFLGQRRAVERRRPAWQQDRPQPPPQPMATSTWVCSVLVGMVLLGCLLLSQSWARVPGNEFEREIARHRADAMGALIVPGILVALLCGRMGASCRRMSGALAAGASLPFVVAYFWLLVFGFGWPTEYYFRFDCFEGSLEQVPIVWWHQTVVTLSFAVAITSIGAIVGGTALIVNRSVWTNPGEEHRVYYSLGEMLSLAVVWCVFFAAVRVLCVAEQVGR